METKSKGGAAIQVDQAGEIFRVEGTDHILTRSELDKLIKLEGGVWHKIEFKDYSNEKE